ncbi:MAG: SAM-dependent methyltransferase [Rhodospirillales bacterium]|nr:SAM-dependent methyltransferase [Rhodospirillales bacterium]
MTGLMRRLTRRIAAEGPISVAEYMAECLLSPRDGYYTAGGEPFGAEGDFVTAPEISQMFGEMIGLWCVDAWQRVLGAPAAFTLVELGPGRGTLMADALRAARVVPGFTRAATLHLVEASPALRARQAEALRGHAPAWHDSLDTVPEGPLLLVANEFFDALPIRQFVRGDRGIHERRIALDESGEGLRFVVDARPSPLSPHLATRLADAPPGTMVEVSPAAESLVAAIAQRIARHGGAALVVDYGAATPGTGDTLQAVLRHKSVAVLDHPGAADLTAHVDFAALAEAARNAGIAAHGPVTQAALLTGLGIATRAERLAAAADAAQRRAITSALDRLLGEAEMGTLFKALALSPQGAAAPAGFAGNME